MAPRNVQIDFLRTLCVFFVTVHHSALRFDGVYWTGNFRGYALSNNLWVLWFLTIMSGMLFGLSTRPVRPYLGRLAVVVLFGIVCNLLGIVISWETNPGGKWPITLTNVLYQMYYVILIGALAVLAYPARQAFIEQKRPNPIMAATVGLGCVALVLSPYFGLPTPNGNPDDILHVAANSKPWPSRPTEAVDWFDCKLQMSSSYATALLCVLGVFVALQRRRPRIAGTLVLFSFVCYTAYTARSLCRDNTYLAKLVRSLFGAILRRQPCQAHAYNSPTACLAWVLPLISARHRSQARFLWWYGFGLMWAAVLKARKHIPEVETAVGCYLKAFESYWLLAVVPMTAAQPAVQMFREPDLRATQSEMVNGMVAMKDVTLILIFLGLSQATSVGADPYGLTAPLNTWSLLVYCMHYAVVMMTPGSTVFPTRAWHSEAASGEMQAAKEQSESQLGVASVLTLSAAIVVLLHKAAAHGRHCRARSAVSGGGVTIPNTGRGRAGGGVEVQPAGATVPAVEETLV